MSHSPDFSDYYSEDEEKVHRPVSAPKIKLKLKLNPSASSTTHEKKPKHKKKHKKKKKNEGHVITGGKRPYAFVDREEEESFHPTDLAQGNLDSFESEEEYEDPSESIPPQTPRLGRPPKQKLRRSSSVKSGSSVSEKPKKRGRPTNKAKAAALLAQLPPKIPENPKRDLKAVLAKLLDNLQKRDTYGFFLEPVDPQFVPDYLKIIQSPMDFSTMNHKLNGGQYKSVQDFRHDFELIVGNTKIYNAIDTIYWKSADKLYEVGSKLLDKAEKQYEEEMALAARQEKNKKEGEEEEEEAGGRIGFYNRKDSLIKEEDVDIMGIDTHSLSLRKQSRQGSEATQIDLASPHLLHPGKSFNVHKKKKKKTTEAGVLYAPDGSLHSVGGVSDLGLLLPLERPFCEAPQLLTSNPSALPSAFYLHRSSVEDAYRNKHQAHAAHFLDYGESYMKSLWHFLGDESALTQVVQDRSDHLTRGAWRVVQKVLERRNHNLSKPIQSEPVLPIETEFGTVDVSSIVDQLEQKLLPESETENEP
ncbi:hypothetical protein BY458DRAFT_525889 [Sporodiniella umbellata]|nr:hypothetical protein BY458DRAFT_525889 [Sporodiniella umbellata]